MTQLTVVKDKVVFPPLSMVATAGIYTVPRRFKRPSKIKLSGKHKALVASSKEENGTSFTCHAAGKRDQGLQLYQMEHQELGRSQRTSKFWDNSLVFPSAFRAIFQTGTHFFSKSSIPHPREFVSPIHICQRSAKRGESLAKPRNNKGKDHLASYSFGWNSLHPYPDQIFSLGELDQNSSWELEGRQMNPGSLETRQKWLRPISLHFWHGIWPGRIGSRAKTGS